MMRDRAPGQWLRLWAAVVIALLLAQPAWADDVSTYSATGNAAQSPMMVFYGAPTAATPSTTPLFAPSAGGAALAAVSPGPAALGPVSVGDRARALDCMSWAIAYEAASQPIAGQEAVGQVILNRLHDPRRPKTVCGVVFQGSERRTGCQFTFACDGSIRRRLSDETMLIARSVASSVLDGAAPAHVGGATHYHANYVSPIWATTGRKVAQIGAHIFYEMPGDAGRSPASMTTPVTTFDEPAIAFASALDHPAAPRRASKAGRRTRQAALAPSSAIPAAAHSLFQPWGLAVTNQP